MLVLRFGWGCVDVYRCVIIAFLFLYRPILHIDSYDRQRLSVANNPQSYRDLLSVSISLSLCIPNVLANWVLVVCPGKNTQKSPT